MLTGESFKLQAELFTPDGHFIKCQDNKGLDLFDNTKALTIGSLTLQGNTFQNLSVGVWTKNNGQVLIGVS
jgi:hypothetical protein